MVIFTCMACRDCICASSDYFYAKKKELGAIICLECMNNGRYLEYVMKQYSLTKSVVYQQEIQNRSISDEQLQQLRL